MLRLLMALSLAGFATLSTAQTPGSAQTAVLASVNQFAEGFNKGDTKILLGSLLHWRKAYFFAILEEMPLRSYLGGFELMILLAVIRLGDDAYGVPILRELLETTGRNVALGSVYATLDRLEQKQLVSSTLGDPTPARGGRAKRYFRVTSKGMREAKTTRKALTRLWLGIPQLAGEPT